MLGPLEALCPKGTFTVNVGRNLTTTPRSNGSSCQSGDKGHGLKGACTESSLPPSHPLLTEGSSSQVELGQEGGMKGLWQPGASGCLS